jgi:hypothetical protein
MSHPHTLSQSLTLMTIDKLARSTLVSSRIHLLTHSRTHSPNTSPGGETPLIDFRQVYRDLNPSVLARFQTQRVRYVDFPQCCLLSTKLTAACSFDSFCTMANGRQQAIGVLSLRNIILELEAVRGKLQIKNSPLFCQNASVNTNICFHHALEIARLQCGGHTKNKTNKQTNKKL